jgi:curved DNA-binding protein CbpA
MPGRTQSNKDYYGKLGLSPDADGDEIRKAYRRLAFQWHPDRNPGNPRATEQFKEISEAYAVLIDPLKRRQYDLARQGNAAQEFRYSQEDILRDLFTNPDASRIFEEIAQEFERMGMHVDRRYFQNTLFGGRTVITGGIFIISPITPFIGLFKLVRAALRGAHSADSLASLQQKTLKSAPNILGGIGRFGRWLIGLPERSGSSEGAEAESELTLPLRLTKSEAEKGGGKKIAVDGGGGVEELLVTVPPGVHTGNRLRLRGKGQIAADGSRGDLYLNIEIKE